MEEEDEINGGSYALLVRSVDGAQRRVEITGQQTTKDYCRSGDHWQNRQIHTKQQRRRTIGDRRMIGEKENKNDWRERGKKKVKEKEQRRERRRLIGEGRGANHTH